LCFPFSSSELTFSHPHGTGITVYIPKFLIKLSKEIGRIKSWIKIHLPSLPTGRAVCHFFSYLEPTSPLTAKKGLPMQTITNERSSELNYEIEGLGKGGGGLCVLSGVLLFEISCRAWLKYFLTRRRFAKVCIGFLGDIFTVAWLSVFTLETDDNSMFFLQTSFVWHKETNTRR
jgi:hypothetical protein